jgi:hypothetical protein
MHSRRQLAESISARQKSLPSAAPPRLAETLTSLLWSWMQVASAAESCPRAVATVLHAACESALAAAPPCRIGLSFTILT